ncbi:acyl-CoA dehydrogenase [Pontibaca methylaminivorans]|uniref:acyl-CoA dehydrogenase n=1 Tax=Pontibaca methylaminivorans TaxID=515897 RepID=UPI002FD90845
MPGYTPPIADFQFLLHDVLDVQTADIPGYAELDRDFTGAILDEAGRLSTELLEPLNRTGDREGCRLTDGAVRTPDGFPAAFRTLREGGWIGLDAPEEFGGQGLPYLLNSAVTEMFSAANQAFTMYQGLTHGAISAILAHGSEAQKALFLPRLVAGDWTGTMNLTEAQCGTDLGLLRTKAEPSGDGSYAISGEKIFISAGEHDLADNIIHLVLARIPGGPEGIRGISLFIVPKFLVNEDGSPGARNAVTCTHLEDKMGIHGNATCAMRYGGATGWLLGQEHRGMQAMFTMMNEARLGVGLQGHAQAAIACQHAAAYARERLQGRAAGGAVNPDDPADPIIVHPDIRRSLMDQRAFVEGGRALLLWGASLIDRAHRNGDAGAEALISLLTPVIKGFLTDEGFAMTVQAQQVFGGHGYIEDNPMAQFVRDARITMIYEGANGIQALDLVGRKLARDGGRQMIGFLEQVRGWTAQNDGDDETFTRTIIAPLLAAADDLQAAGLYFMKEGTKDPDNALAGSTDFLHLFGHLCLGFMWARMARAAWAALENGAPDAPAHEARLATARYYMARRLPATALHLARIRSGAAPVMALAPGRF